MKMLTGNYAWQLKNHVIKEIGIIFYFFLCYFPKCTSGCKMCAAQICILRNLV